MSFLVVIDFGLYLALHQHHGTVMFGCRSNKSGIFHAAGLHATLAIHEDHCVGVIFLSSKNNHRDCAISWMVGPIELVSR